MNINKIFLSPIKKAGLYPRKHYFNLENFFQKLGLLQFSYLKI